MRIVRYAAVLAAICILSALGVAGTYRLTRPRIQEKERTAREQAQREVIPGTEAGDVSFEVLNPDAKPEAQVVRAMGPDGAVLGYAAVGAAQGYSSRVRIMVGLGPALEKIVGVKVVAQQETPGLGTRIAEVKSDKTIVGLVTGKGGEQKAADPTPAFMKQFIGLEYGAVRLSSSGDGGRVQAISGATISSTAAVNATRNAIERIREVVSGDDTTERQ